MKVFKGLQNRQHEIALDIINDMTHKYFIIRSSRQSGKTYLLERLTIYFALFKTNQCGAFIMASCAQTTKVYNSLIKLIPSVFIKNTKAAGGMQFINFTNGSTLNFFSANSFNSVAGNSFDYIICDEFALWTSRAWGIIRPTTAAKVNAKVVIASTPRGKNEFYNMCMNGINPDDEFTMHYRMSWQDNKFYDVREVEHAKKSLPDGVFKQEYEAEFLLNNSNVFGKYNNILSIKSFPSYDNKLNYYFGIDWAGDGEDATVLTIMNDKGEVVFVSEYESSNHVTMTNLMTTKIKQYDAIGYAECNGLGKGATDMLIYNGLNVHKWYMSNESKQVIVSEFIQDINNETVRIPDSELFPQIDFEMSTFVASRTGGNKLKYSHDNGYHDDYVDSLMMANHARHIFGGDKSILVDSNYSNNAYVTSEINDFIDSIF